MMKATFHWDFGSISSGHGHLLLCVLLDPVSAQKWPLLGGLQDLAGALFRRDLHILLLIWN
jgi:hypothetical protein